MQADFLDAHGRHWNDAEKLFMAQRWANADHLYGIAAECGLKCLMLVFGMPYDATTDKPSLQADRKHANDIWDRYDSYRSGHHQGAGYALKSSNPFSNWHVAQRYAHQNQFSQAISAVHQAGALEVHQLVKKAEIEGFI